MLQREPFRTTYIQKLCDEKNIEWLKKELFAVDTIIKEYSAMLLMSLTDIERKRITESLEHKKQIKKNIEECLFKLFKNRWW